jgi:hypothetical protein
MERFSGCGLDELEQTFQCRLVCRCLLVLVWLLSAELVMVCFELYITFVW